MKTYVAPSMTASEFDNHDIVRVFGGGREYYHDEGGAPLPDLFYVEYHGTAGNPVPSGMSLYALVADLPIPASSPVRYVGTTQGQSLCQQPNKSSTWLQQRDVCGIPAAVRCGF